MGPKKKVETKMFKKKKEVITMEVKKEMIEKHEAGMRVSDIAKLYSKSTSTICTILKKKEEIKGLDAAKGVTRVSKQRPRVLEDVEKLLLVWINKKQLAGDTVNENLICRKAKALYTELVSKLPSTSRESEESFKASRGWFDNFKRRSGIHSVLRRGEAASSDAEAFTAQFQELIRSECYLQQQVFNCNETSLFWKKMPRRTYITEEESAMPGPKPMKDRLTLLLCTNASGELKVKPLLVYHSENPRAFKKCKVQKSQLNVMWRSSSKPWVTRILFVEWMNMVFGPEVKKYLLERNLPLKVLLVMDNSPAHPPGLEDDLLEEFKFIKVKFLPPNNTPLLQPMDQHVISNFKKLYTKALFQQCFEVTEGTNLSLRDFWKNQFNIVNCLKLIDKAWNGVTNRTITSAWAKLWSDSVVGHDIEGCAEFEPIVDEIVFLGKAMGLEVNEDDIEELVEEHGQELTTEELMDLHCEQQKEVMEVILTGKEVERSEDSLIANEIQEEHGQELTTEELMDLHCEQQKEVMEVILTEKEEERSEDSLTANEIQEEHGQELTTEELMDLHCEQQKEVMEVILTEKEEERSEDSLTANEIQEMCKMWETLQNFVEKHHPNKVVAVRAMNLFNDHAMSHFRGILKKRQKSLDRFLIKSSPKRKKNLMSQRSDISHATQ